jgi:hypothetical protein
MEGESIPEKFLVGNFVIQEQWENQKMLEGRRQVGHTTDPIEYEDGGEDQGPEGVVDCQMCGLLITKLILAQEFHLKIKISSKVL